MAKFLHFLARGWVFTPYPRVMCRLILISSPHSSHFCSNILFLFVLSRIMTQVHAVEFLLNRSFAKDVLLEYCANLSAKACAEVVHSALDNFSSEKNYYHFRRDGLDTRLDEFAGIFKRFGEIFHHSERKSSMPGTTVSVELDEVESTTQLMPRKVRGSCYSIFSTYS